MQPHIASERVEDDVTKHNLLVAKLGLQQDGLVRTLFSGRAAVLVGRMITRFAL